MPAEIAATATFASGQVSGSNGCNSYSGPYQASGSSLTVGPLDVDDDGLWARPERHRDGLHDGLPGGRQLHRHRAQLTIYDTSGARPGLQPQAAITLVGTPWTVTSYNNGKQATRRRSSTRPSRSSSGPTATVSGNATCNTYNGTFTTDGDALTIGPLATTGWPARPTS